MPNSTQDRLTYNTLASINMNLMRILTLLEKIERNGLNVKTQESHSP